MARYKHRRKTLKKDKEAWDAEKRELRSQLEDAHINVEAEKIASQESTAKAENQSCQRGQGELMEYFQEFLETLAPGDFQQGVLRSLCQVYRGPPPRS